MTSVSQLIGPDDADAPPSAYECPLEDPSGKVCERQSQHQKSAIRLCTKENP